MMTFCEECREMVTYISKNVSIEKDIKGKIIKFEGEEAYCPKCSEKLFVAAIRDNNLKRLDDEYRKMEGLVTVDEIKQILNKYNIGKRPLSNLLGWGEITITRYLDGTIPTKQYSDTLYGLLKDPIEMRSVLEKNKGSITDSAYKKCKEAISEGINRDMRDTSNDNKIDSVTKYFLSKLEITPLALQKLLYYSQGFNMAFYGKPLFIDDCEAWSYGPVYNDVYHRYKKYGCNPIDAPVVCDGGVLNISNSEQEVLDSVMRNFGCYSAKVLVKMTHSEYPWLATRNGISDEDPSNNIIDKELISKYFKQIKKKYDMLNISDISDYSKNLFEKLQA